MTTPRQNVLVVDDEPPIRTLLRTGLSTKGFSVLQAGNARSALDLLKREKVDLVILDLGLPDMKGVDLLRIIRERSPATPIIVLSSRDDERGKVEALDLGADDYVTKPFGMGELLARMRTALRHRLQMGGERPVFLAGDLSVDLVRRLVKMKDREIRLAPREYELLRHLVQHAGKAMTHTQLLRLVWGDSLETQYLRVYVRQLRQKIEPDPERPAYILTETGVGYRLRAADETHNAPGERSMTLEQILAPEHVLHNLAFSSKAALLERLARHMGAALSMPVDVLRTALSRREELGSTGMGGGVALPHARLSGVARPFGVFVKLRSPLSFEAIDDRLVDVVFSLLLPADKSEEAISALAVVARKLRDHDSLQRIRNATDAAALFKAVVT